MICQPFCVFGPWWVPWVLDLCHVPCLQTCCYCLSPACSLVAFQFCMDLCTMPPSPIGTIYCIWCTSCTGTAVAVLDSRLLGLYPACPASLPLIHSDSLPKGCSCSSCSCHSSELTHPINWETNLVNRKVVKPLVKMSASWSLVLVFFTWKLITQVLSEEVILDCNVLGPEWDLVGSLC